MSFENGLIDLRSDTVTHPTPAMRAAMARAEVGDDVFGDDPTVHRLQEMAAALTGHEAGLFVASGTMANLVALLTHCGRGSEVIVGNNSHIYLNEVGGMAALGGLQAAPSRINRTARSGSQTSNLRSAPRTCITRAHGWCALRTRRIFAAGSRSRRSTRSRQPNWRTRAG